MNTRIADAIFQGTDDPEASGWEKINPGKALGQPGPGTDTISPTASVASPASGDVVRRTVNIQVIGTDNAGVTRVEAYVDGVLPGGGSGLQAGVAWNTANWLDGSH